MRWSLADGAERNGQHPDSFLIPSESARHSLEPGDVVRQCFEYEYDDCDDIGGERMWVEITSVEDSNYVGILRSHTLFADDEIHFGQQITFLPKHVIDIKGN
jgi:hypothetical protein